MHGPLNVGISIEYNFSCAIKDAWSTFWITDSISCHPKHTMPTIIKINQSVTHNLADHGVFETPWPLSLTVAMTESNVCCSMTSPIEFLQDVSFVAFVFPFLHTASLNTNIFVSFLYLSWQATLLTSCTRNMNGKNYWLYGKMFSCFTWGLW